MADPAGSVYRCEECGHGLHLTAWAAALTFGPLGADGQLEGSGIWDEVIHEDSIECSRHPDATIEKLVDGQWCRWWVCPQCKGKQRRPGWPACPEPGLPPEPRTYGERHVGWRPVELATIKAGNP
jgi:hypothetical protein